jgi:hypothetical protein
MRQQARRGAVGTCRRRLNPMTTERSPPSETGNELLPGPPAGPRTFTATTCAAGESDGGFALPTAAAGRRPLPTSQASPGRASPCGRPDAYAARPRHRRPRRPCHYRAIHNGRERLQADTHGQSYGRHGLRRSSSGQVAILPDLALQARGRLVEACIGSLPCPAGRSVPGRGGPERRRRPRSDGTGSTGATLGPHAIRRPRTTPVSSGQSPALLNGAIRPLRRFSQRPSSP